ncbi:nicotinamidase [Thauera sp. CAU 1555]|uniref:nicotinamidase n=1 Tax=Thauera sedimentorum TaxID=2767595 RepID=A0ABR9B9K1_9RHOO|nr:nicotinamidase [Thauera sedimentorum]MBC9072107.1 nicotinamidase [Thauera sedimentorum]MBD8503026.1 nicotinamidase [Thauera sedimentorum]
MQSDAETPSSSLHPAAGDALLVVDLQRDFLPGGALAVADGNAVVPVLNRYIDLFSAARLPRVFSRDWHPANHVSFAERGGPWPPHCIAETTGASFAPGLNVPPDAYIVSKATGAEADAYSAFQGTDLAGWLRHRGCRRVFVGGLATDYCVRETVLDALALGFEAVLLTDAVRAVEVEPGDGRRALEAMIVRGARPATLQAIAGEQA